jgi:competence protein ComEC
MAIIHFLNVLEGDCSIIQHDSGRISVIDVSNAYDATDTEQEKLVKAVKDKEVKANNFVPNDKVNYNQKKNPDNPIDYINTKIKTKDIFRFIITHPDMDHLDGLKDFYSEFKVANTWLSENTKELDLKTFPNKYNPDDWKFYTEIRDGKYTDTKKLTYKVGDDNSYFKEDNIKILCPTSALIKQANAEGGDIHDLSYVLLFTFPKKGGGTWKFIFSGDSHDNSWEYILKTFEADIKNIDVLFAPHHGRDSKRNYDFLKTITPSVTLMGNASSDHLAYTSYPKTRITNNQAGHIMIDINEDRLLFLVKNKEFADNYCNKENRKWGEATYYEKYDAYGLFQIEAK